VHRGFVAVVDVIAGNAALRDQTELVHVPTVCGVA